MGKRVIQWIGNPYLKHFQGVNITPLQGEFFFTFLLLRLLKKKSIIQIERCLVNIETYYLVTIMFYLKKTVTSSPLQSYMFMVIV